MAVVVEESAMAVAEESMAGAVVVLAVEESAVAAVAVTIAGGCDCCLL